jgi:hypothetical protein
VLGAESGERGPVSSAGRRRVREDSAAAEARRESGESSPRRRRRRSVGRARGWGWGWSGVAGGEGASVLGLAGSSAQRWRWDWNQAAWRGIVSVSNCYGETVAVLLTRDSVACPTRAARVAKRPSIGTESGLCRGRWVGKMEGGAGAKRGLVKRAGRG